MFRTWLVALLFSATCALAIGGSSALAHPARPTAKPPIIIGLALAKSGFMATYDKDDSNAFLMKLAEVNAQGGVLGRRLTTQWVDTKTDLTTAASAAEQLITSDHAALIIASADATYGAPQVEVANRHGEVGISFNAGSITYGDAHTLGKLVFTFGEAGDDYASADAEWAYQKMHWHRAYVLNDNALDYNKVLARYFPARWHDLGGTIVGTDNWTGTTSNAIGPQVSRLRSDVSKIDFIYINSFGTDIAQAFRQIRAAGITLPIFAGGVAGNGGPEFTKITGPAYKYYTGMLVCYLDCRGQPDPRIEAFLKKYEAKYGVPQTGDHPVVGYDLATLLIAAIKKAGTTDGPALAKALETLPKLNLLSGPFKFSATCHKATGRPLPIVEYNGLKARFVTLNVAKHIPNIGDNNPCLH